MNELTANENQTVSFWLVLVTTIPSGHANCDLGSTCLPCRCDGKGGFMLEIPALIPELRKTNRSQKEMLSNNYCRALEVWPIGFLTLI